MPERLSNSNLLIERLEFVRSVGSGKWSARCPAHDDKDPSLAISEAPDGRILVHCFAGCGALDIISSVGLTWDALYPEGSERYRPLVRRPKDAQHEAAVLTIIGAQRASGKRLSAAEKAREREAWMKVNGRAS